MQFPFDLLNRITITSSGFAHLVFYVMALITAVMSGVLFFHWQKYGMEGRVLRIMEGLYLFVSVLLLLVAFGGLN